MNIKSMKTTAFKSEFTEPTSEETSWRIFGKALILLRGLSTRKVRRSLQRGRSSNGKSACGERQGREVRGREVRGREVRGTAQMAVAVPEAVEAATAVATAEAV